MDINAAYREVGTYRGAAAICGTTPKTVKRIVEGAERETGAKVAHNYDSVRDLVAQRVEKTQGRITAKRLLPAAVAAGYTGSARNFRRLVADSKKTWRSENHRGRRPGVWEPGDMLVIDWGEIGPLFVFCAVLGWSRWRFVFFADNLGEESTLTALAACLKNLAVSPRRCSRTGWAASRAAPSQGLWSRPPAMSASPPTMGSGPISVRARTPNPRASWRTWLAT